jgi:hypothetical protein
MKWIDEDGRAMTRAQMVASKSFRLVDRDGPAPFVCSTCGRKSWFLEPGTRCVMTQKNGRKCEGLFVANA